MYVIMVYDVAVERVSQVLTAARKYLHWVQNSVLEGEVSEANLLKLQNELTYIIDKERDSVIFYILRTTKYFTRLTMGRAKGSTETFI
jgi:CRISPR-associated protein Cas2